MKLTFLGTGGGRFTMINQLRQTGGMYLETEDFRLSIDPGPGALVHARHAGIPLASLDALLVTHAHLDHYGDMNVLVEAMTDGGNTVRGTLLVNNTLVNGATVPDRYATGKGVYGRTVAPVLDDYHHDLVDEVIVMEDGEETALGPFTLRCIEMAHSDPHTIGFILERADRRYGFVTDTELFDGMTDFFMDCDVLVCNLMRPRDKPWKGHLTTADVASIVETVQPETVVLQHFGSAIIYGSIADEVTWLQGQVDTDIVVARDGMTVDLDDPQQDLSDFL